MTDLINRILPADLLPEAVREYVEESKRLDERYGGGNISDSDFWARRWADDYSDAAIAAALELAAKYKSELDAERAKRCGTCRKFGDAKKCPFGDIDRIDFEHWEVGCTRWEARYE